MLRVGRRRGADYLVLNHWEQKEYKLLKEEREINERRHREIVIRLAQLEQKRLGQGYRFQNSHEHT